MALVTGFETTLGSLKCLRSKVFFGIKARRRRRCTTEIKGSKEEEAVVKEVYGGCGGADECGVWETRFKFMWFIREERVFDLIWEWD